MQREALDQRPRLVESDAGALHPYRSGTFHGPGGDHALPFAPPSRNVLEQRPAHGRHVRRAARYRNYRNSQAFVQRLQIDDIEARKRDALQQHRPELRCKARSLHHVGHHARGVCTVTAHPRTEHAFEARAREHRADDENVTAVPGVEGGVVNSDDVRSAFHAHGVGEAARRRLSYS